MNLAAGVQGWVYARADMDGQNRIYIYRAIPKQARHWIWSLNLNRIVEIEPFKIKYLPRTVLPHIRVERWSRNYNKQIMCDMAYVLPGRVPSLPWYAHWQSSWIYWVPSGQGLGVHLWPISCSYHFGPRLDCLNTHSGSTANVHVIYEPQHDKTKKKICAPSKNSDQPGHPSSLIRVFAVHSVGS